MIGLTLGHYEVQALLGAGGMGEVYRARDLQLGREVAIKVLPEAVLSEPDRVARFEREAKVLAALNHANIAALLRHGGIERPAFPDHRSDVFSFGVVLHEMLTGRQPFQGDTAAEVMASVMPVP